MFENIFPVIRDIVVIGYMFVLRIGVPIIVMMFIGWWLQRKLVEWDAKEIAEFGKKQVQEKERGTSEVPLHM